MRKLIIIILLFIAGFAGCKPIPEKKHNDEYIIFVNDVPVVISEPSTKP